MKDIITDSGELYEWDPKFENRLDVVVQHMCAAGFSNEEIIRDTKVSEEFIKRVCTPSK